MTKKTATNVATMKSSKNNVDVDLRFIRGNEEQSRGAGVCPTLEEKGIGVLARMEKFPDNECLWELIFNADNNAEKWAKACELLEKHEPKIVEMAGSLTVHGQLENIGVRPLSDDECEKLVVPAGSMNTVYGMRRCIGKAYNYAKSVGKLKPTLSAFLVDWHEKPQDTFFMSLAENTTRENESPVDQALYFKKLKKQGMNNKDISEATGVDYQTIRNRLLILDLPQEVQDKIHTGKASWTVEVKKYAEQVTADKAAKDGSKAPEKSATAPKATPTNGDRRRIPTLKQAEKLFTLLEKPAEMPDDEWAVVSDEGFRKAIAYYGGWEYLTRKDLKKKKSEDEKQAHLAEMARKAAAEAEEPAEAAK